MSNILKYYEILEMISIGKLSPNNLIIEDVKNGNKFVYSKKLKCFYKSGISPVLCTSMYRDMELIQPTFRLVNCKIITIDEYFEQLQNTLKEIEEQVARM